MTFTFSAARTRRFHADRRTARSGAAGTFTVWTGALILVASAASVHAGDYVPPRGEWAALEAAEAGFAFTEGRIASLDDPVARYVPGSSFEGEHDAAITWRHLLEQSSDWRGTLWDVPDWADRPTGATLREWQNQPLVPPGTVHEYNDVRVNLLALSLLNVMREPLPRILRERIMDPIGASSTWRWHGYQNSWVEIDGLRVQSVAGGAISAAGCSSRPRISPGSGC